MRYVVISTVLSLMACGNSDKPPPDLAAAIEIDFSQPADLTAPMLDTASSDFTFSACTAPKTGIYNETVQYSYVPAAGGPSTFAAFGSTVVVKNDGSYSRPSTTFTSPDRYHCAFVSVDSITCLAPCCPGQTSSPTMYFDSGGWTLWTGGACSFQTVTGAQFIANIADVEAYFTR